MSHLHVSAHYTVVSVYVPVYLLKWVSFDLPVLITVVGFGVCSGEPLCYITRKIVKYLKYNTVICKLLILGSESTHAGTM
jgi:hypothetical protein